MDLQYSWGNPFMFSGHSLILPSDSFKVCPFSSKLQHLNSPFNLPNNSPLKDKIEVSIWETNFLLPTTTKLGIYSEPSSTVKMRGSPLPS